MGVKNTSASHGCQEVSEWDNAWLGRHQTSGRRNAKEVSDLFQIDPEGRISNCGWKLQEGEVWLKVKEKKNSQSRPTMGWVVSEDTKFSLTESIRDRAQKPMFLDIIREF